MNEGLFLGHIVLIISFLLIGVRLGVGALTGLVAIQAVLANLFVTKQISLFGLNVTCSDVFAIGGMLGLNLLQEYFGQSFARKAIHISFFTMLFFLCMAQIHLWYIPSILDLTQDAFQTILSATPRIILASLTTYFIVQRLDVWLFGFLKQKLQGRRLFLRMTLSLILTQWVDTVLFSFFGLYGIVGSILHVIGFSFLVKCSIIILGTPLAVLSKRWMRHDISV